MSNALDDLRQSLADVICRDRAVDNWQAMPSDYDLADAIIAALPGLVLPLEWDGPNCGIWDAGKRFHGDCAAYKIIWDLGRKETYITYFGNQRLGVFNTLEAAKDAAQAHHVAQIMAVFGIDTAAMKEGKDA